MLQSARMSPPGTLDEAAPRDADPGGAWAPRWLLAAPLAAVLLFLAPAWTGGGLFLARDDGRMHAPVKAWLAGELAAGRWPAWNPLAGLGAPVIPAAVDGLQHPFTLLLLAFPIGPALTAWVVLSLLLAAAGATWWARVLGAGPAGAAVAGLAFALSGPLASATDNLAYLTALAAAPAYLAAAHAFSLRGGPGRLAALAGLSFLLAAAGDPVSWGLAVLAAPALSLALGDGAAPGRAGLAGRLERALAGAGAAAVAAAPVILPVALWLPHSSRAGALDELSRRRWSLAPIRLVEYGVPDLLRAPPGTRVSPLHQALADPTSLAPWSLSVYLGAAVLLLALGALRADRRARRLALGAAVFTWMALGPHAGFGQLAARLPLLQGLRYWEKLAPWTALLLAGAAALSVDRLLQPGREPGATGGAAPARRLAWASGVVAALALGAAPLSGLLAAPVGPSLAPALQANLRGGLLHAGAVAAALGLVALLVARGHRGAGVALVLLVAVDLAAANARAWELQDPSILAPPGPLAVALRAAPGSGAGLARVVTPFEPVRSLPGLTDDEATNLLGARTLAAAWNVGLGVANFDTYTGPVPARAAVVERRLAPARYLPTVGLWGVGHLVVPGSLAKAGALGLSPPWRVVAEDPALPAWLLAVPHRPRAYLAARVRAVDEAGALAFALDPATPAGEVTVVEALAGAATGLTAGAAGGAATISMDTPTRVVVEVRPEGPALLVLSDTWAPGWTAAVDGRPAPILRANYLVRAVALPAGARQVVFEYRTPGLAAGWGAALLGALGLGGLAWRGRSRGSAPPRAAR